MLNEIFNATTKTEIFLFITTVFFCVLWLAKSNAVDGLKFHLMDARMNAHKMYLMYCELSTNTLDIVNKWQKCEDDNKEMFRKLNTPK